MDSFVLNYGTDDVTEFYAELLKRISIPYKELDMTRRTDREMMDDLRIRTCILFDVSHSSARVRRAMAESNTIA
jgi:hypothetical protein